MLWRLLFISLIGGAQCKNSNGCPGKAQGGAQCMNSNGCPGSPQDLINTTNSFTSQSSDYTDSKQVYSSVRATDGNETVCAITNDELNPWWRIDLLGVYNISCISIYNTDQRNTDMRGALIHIGNSRENNGTNNPICTEMTNFTVEQWNDYTCTEQVSGRYVTVVFPGKKTLILCEVKIYGKKIGGAQCKNSNGCHHSAQGGAQCMNSNGCPGSAQGAAQCNKCPETGDLINTTNSFTSQSSNYTDSKQVYSSVRATDGDETVCAITNDEPNPWWRIDLLGVYNISCISIYNTNKDHTDMRGARIHIGNSRENNGTNNPICTEMTNFTPEQWNNYTCKKQVSGRYVTVVFPGKKTLILCEVKIYGKKKASPFQLIEEKKMWEHAIEYCRERDMDLATILDEDDQTLAELEARRAGTPYVWLGLHYTCILEVWFWVADYRLEFNRWAPGEKTGDCDRSAVMSRAEGHQWFSKSDYDEFHFICQKF